MCMGFHFLTNGTNGSALDSAYKKHCCTATHMEQCDWVLNVMHVGPYQKNI